MNADIESALVSYLTDALPGAYAALRIVPATNAGEKPVAVPFVIVQVQALNRVVG